MTAAQTTQAQLEAIAKEYIVAVDERGGLQTTNSGADFFEASAWGIEQALKAAYAAGLAAAQAK